MGKSERLTKALMAKLICCMLFGLTAMVMLNGPVLAQAAEPAAVVDKINAKLLDAMKGGDEMGFSGRFSLLKPVILESFAFKVMARISTGRHWKKLNADQRSRLIALYQDWSAAAYADRFDAYKGEHFETSPPEKGKGRTVNITSHLVKPSGKKVKFLYKLLKVGGKWLIVDIHTKGLSQLANTRAQFISVLNEKGFGTLEQTMLDKIKDLSS
jgi:phospholipid transport system substrate-binding protein